MKRKKSNYKMQNNRQKKPHFHHGIEVVKDSEIRVIGKKGFEKSVEDYFKRLLNTNNVATECAAEVPETSNVEKLLGEIVNNQKRLIRIVEEIEWKVENINDRIKLKAISSQTPNYPCHYPDKISYKARC